MLQTDHSPALDYIRVVLEKTKNNRGLALIIFKKLFDELPAQLERIEDCLNSGDYDCAREVTHKLHGSVSFCGLNEIQEPAKKLELCLINGNYRSVADELPPLKQQVLTFIRYRDPVLAGLDNSAIQ